MRWTKHKDAALLAAVRDGALTVAEVYRQVQLQDTVFGGDDLTAMKVRSRLRTLYRRLHGQDLGRHLSRVVNRIPDVLDEGRRRTTTRPEQTISRPYHWR